MASSLLRRSHHLLRRPHLLLLPSLFFSSNASSIYNQLLSTDPTTFKLPKSQYESISTIVRSFSKSPTTADQSLAIYIPSSFLPTATSAFRKFFLPRCTPDMAHNLSDAYLLPIFFEFCLNNYADELRKFKTFMETADMTMPHTWFPFARSMKRKVVYHCGPTNSGKTYNALQRFMEAKNGVYCSPLRLLAMEVFDRVNAVGVYCSLLTGQEKKRVVFAEHVACTIEMVSVEEEYEVAVIDEIQMMSDSGRGHAWTKALLGLKADEIHLCGDPSTLSVVENICRETGDVLEVNLYDRFKPLVVEAKSLLGDYKNVRAGDCIVAFSRREIFEVRLAVERFTKHKCCVIYGALPPETRRQQANLFNDQVNEFDVLVASDAVGMGLNLNIRRVIFYTLEKYNGDKLVPVPASQVKQIAGRAGRRGSIYPDGLVTTFLVKDLDYLIECLKQPFEVVKKVGLFPCFEQVELFAGKYPASTFCELLDKFRDSCRLDESYFLCQHESARKVANMLEKIQGLSLQDRYNFCFAPVNIRDPKAMFHLFRFASQYSQNRPVGLTMGMPRGSARNDQELLDMETKHQVLSMYMWLSNHFKEDTFPFKEKAEVMATGIAELLGKSLAIATWKPESRGRPKAQEEEDGKADELEEDHGHEKPSSVPKDGYERPRSLVGVRKKTDNKSVNFVA